MKRFSLAKACLTVCLLTIASASLHAQTNTFPATGNVGIGTTTPSAPLSFGSSLSNSKLALWDNGTVRLGLGIQSNQFRFHLGSYAQRFSFFDAEAGNELMTLTGGGNLGIGTNAPIAKLDVVGGKLRVATNPGQMTAANLDDINGALGFGGIVENHGGDLHLRSFWGVSIDKNGGNLGEGADYTSGVNPAGGAFSVRTRTSATAFRTDFIIRNDGNVGIGTKLLTNPNNYKLAVNGTIGARAVKVETSSTTWADYVFLPSYRLRPLSEVESYIQQNQHLPEVPSAAEVEKNGHNLGEMDATLLKKIEELTLYVIEQNKLLKQLKQENEAQSLEINHLKKGKR